MSIVARSPLFVRVICVKTGRAHDFQFHYPQAAINYPQYRQSILTERSREQENGERLEMGIAFSSFRASTITHTAVSFANRQ